MLDDCFDGQITLTNVTGTQPSEQRAADMVLHYVRHAGVAVFSGMAVRDVGGCPNVLVSSEAPPSWGQEPYSPELLNVDHHARSGTHSGSGMPPTCWRAPT